jgi:hypothetical protein
MEGDDSDVGEGDGSVREFAFRSEGNGNGCTREEAYVRGRKFS